MSSLIIKGDTSGAITLSAPNAAGDSTYTLPAVNGSVMVSGNMPAFSVSGANPTSLINNTDTKIIYDTEEFDTNNNFASSRFTPTVAGYYQLNACVLINLSSGILGVMLYKNGGRFKYGVQTINTTLYAGATFSTLVYANGTTDYFEVYAINSGGTANNLSGSIYNHFTGYLVRPA